MKKKYLIESDRNESAEISGGESIEKKLRDNEDITLIVVQNSLRSLKIIYKIRNL